MGVSWRAYGADGLKANEPQQPRPRWRRIVHEGVDPHDEQAARAKCGVPVAHKRRVESTNELVTVPEGGLLLGYERLEEVRAPAAHVTGVTVYNGL